MGEPDLLSWRPEHKARRDDPETSHAAARQAKSMTAEHYRLILAALDGEELHATEIAWYCALTTSQVQRRLKELLTAGLIELTGETRTNSNGRRMRVFRRRS